MAHQMEPEREFELLAEGRLNQEAHYKRAMKEYSSFTVDSFNPGEHKRTQKGLDKRISNPG